MEIIVGQPEHAFDILKVRQITRSETYPDDSIGATREFYYKRNQPNQASLKKERAALLDTNRFQYWVALEDVTMAGFTRVIKGERQSVDMIHVLKEYRGQGLGNQFLELATNALDRTKLAYLEVVKGNGTALAWYARHGWRDTGEMRNGTPLPNGTFVSEHIMVLDPISTSPGEALPNA